MIALPKTCYRVFYKIISPKEIYFGLTTRGLVDHLAVYYFPLTIDVFPMEMVLLNITFTTYGIGARKGIYRKFCKNLHKRQKQAFWERSYITVLDWKGMSLSHSFYFPVGSCQDWRHWACWQRCGRYPALWRKHSCTVRVVNWLQSKWSSYSKWRSYL